VESAPVVNQLGEVMCGLGNIQIFMPRGYILEMIIDGKLGAYQHPRSTTLFIAIPGVSSYLPSVS
jgi:hypothetical protein